MFFLDYCLLISGTVISLLSLLNEYYLVFTNRSENTATNILYHGSRKHFVVLLRKRSTRHKKYYNFVKKYASAVQVKENGIKSTCWIVSERCQISRNKQPYSQTQSRTNAVLTKPIEKAADKNSL